MYPVRYGRRIGIIFGAVLATSALQACRDGEGEDPDTDVGGAADGDGDADGDGNGNGDGNGGICSEEALSLDYHKVKLMIALDMSGSMVTPDSKYLDARDAVENMIGSFSNRFLFGFDTYPDQFFDESCTVDGPVWFDCEEGNETAIVSWLEAHLPVKGAGDPLLLELKRFLNTPSYAPKFSANASKEDAYLLILADGDDCCGPDAIYDCAKSWKDELATETRALSDTGIKTIVVGYTWNADPESLDAVAKNGGSPFDSYIPALDPAALTDALLKIAGKIASCNFEISAPDPSADPNKINFYFDDTVVPFNEGCAAGGIGWTWENNTHTAMRFCEQSCNQLSEEDITDVSAKFGCPSVTVV